MCSTAFLHIFRQNTMMPVGTKHPLWIILCRYEALTRVWLKICTEKCTVPQSIPLVISIISSFLWLDLIILFKVLLLYCCLSQLPFNYPAGQLQEPPSLSSLYCWLSLLLRHKLHCNTNWKPSNVDLAFVEFLD